MLLHDEQHILQHEQPAKDLLAYGQHTSDAAVKCGEVGHLTLVGKTRLLVLARVGHAALEAEHGVDERARIELGFAHEPRATLIVVRLVLVHVDADVLVRVGRF